MKVYVLTWLVADSGYDGETILGIFENKEDAEKIRDKNKAEQENEGFYVNEYQLNYYRDASVFGPGFIHKVATSEDD